MVSKALVRTKQVNLFVLMTMDKKWMVALEEMDTMLISKHKKANIDSGGFTSIKWN